MRRIVVALVVALLALTLVGCGAEETPPEEAVVPAPVAAPVSVEASSPDRSDNDSDTLPAPFPSFTTTATPAVFQEKLDAGRPMLILFYDDAQQVTVDTRKEIDAVMADYRGLIDFVVFDVGDAATSADDAAAVLYASELAVPSTPYVLVVDKGGFITWRSKGFAEREIVGREVERATR